MGACGSSEAARGRGTAAESGDTAKVVHAGDGRAWEYAGGTSTAAGSGGRRRAPVGQVYFLLPLASLRRPLSLPDLCQLAGMAATAFRRLPRHATTPPPPKPAKSLLLRAVLGGAGWRWV
ncbi:unnamed protein product [Spirodela intermedia]|uniref:Uncharacterized protein n=1 Tax=Spirodela intermedia TaxID=51605 RepID=A0A7I8IIU1_SPIIN|nr:unnamed protein product [Spirodela intermedia]CAA6657725.1 unnamed protein product [Spirodela intermedia]